MSTSVEEALVHEHLTRLRAALAGQPADQQREVLAEVESHIASARAEMPDGEAGVRTVLERLGDPGDIAASAGAAPAPAPAAPPPSARGEIVGLLFLALGGLVIPFAGWIVGLVLLWTSRIWTRGDKLLGTLLIPGGLGSVPWLIILPTRTDSSPLCTVAPGQVAPCPEAPPSPDVLLLALLVVAVVGSLLTLIVLAQRVARRA